MDFGIQDAESAYDICHRDTLTCMQRILPLMCLLAALLFVPLAWGHYTWLARTHYNNSGDRVYLEIGHGHDFPTSEEAPASTHLKVFAETAGGKQTPVEFKKEGNALKLEVPLPDRSLRRVYYTRDRGVMSQTAAGWKEGGKDQHPGAKASMKSTQYGIAWVGFSGTTNSAKALGLDLELNYEQGLKGRRVRVLRKGKAARNIEVTAVLGEDKEKALGKSDRDGYVSADALPEHAAILFSVRVEEAAPKGANYDKTVLACTLSLPGE